MFKSLIQHPDVFKNAKLIGTYSKVTSPKGTSLNRYAKQNMSPIDEMYEKDARSQNTRGTRSTVDTYKQSKLNQLQC